LIGSKVMAYKWPLYDLFWPNFWHMCVYLSQNWGSDSHLRGLMDLNIDWVKSYGLRCSLRPRASSANSQKIATDRWSFSDHIWPFFANCMFVFHKTQIQTVILRCLMSLNLNWYKSYDKKHKNAKKAKDANVCFCKKMAKKKKWKYLHFVS
jgi:hypothetical protein